MKIKILPYCSKFGPCFLNIDDINKKYFTMESYKQIFEYFLPNNDLEYKLTNSDDTSDICITSINLPDKNLLKDDEINIMICIENIKNPLLKFYEHYNVYGEYGNDKIRIYIYSHIDKLVKNHKYLAIPAIYCRINYFKLKYQFYYNSDVLNCPFEKKKFCLAINQSGLNKDIENIKKILSTIDMIDNISLYSDKINFQSCYNSIELLKIMNKYKFIICFENSYLDGYITEKIFNCFFAKSIPIYSGSKIITRFFNNNSFINLDENNFQNYIPIINEINSNKTLYEKYISLDKINYSYDDENYQEEFFKYLKKE
jgi:hypothetical protein